MSIMGIGPIELVVVLVIAYLVLGPERMITTIRSLGKLVRDLKEQTSGFPKSMDEMLEPTTLENDDETRKESPGVARPRKTHASQATGNEDIESSTNEARSKE
ncbi:uncharacterized protein METZ01_LOCUS265411 [marine metagenome]|uniref:Twin-arginine translocase TatA/TatE family subunit n=1 Tax=marine metagenome TaxID=408172 RepID=A0A382JNA0_9ZZZZ